METLTNELINTWVNDNYPEFISYDWDGETLEIFMDRNERVIEISKEEIENSI